MKTKAKTRSESKKKMTLKDLLVIKIQALYDVEAELIKALPKMASKASDQELKKVFRMHLDETRAHEERLVTVFELLGQKPKKLKVEAIRGLIKDAAWVMKNTPTKEALDAALIAAATYVEHYEMAGYAAAVEWAQELGYNDIASTLANTMHEETEADQKLSGLGMLTINRRILPESQEGSV